jgi:head-tail adaptor
MSVRERIAFWAKLPGRLAALGNRVGPDEHAKLYTAIHARIPMVTSDEQRDVQEENAKDEESFWGAMRDINAATAEDHIACFKKTMNSQEFMDEERKAITGQRDPKQ